MKYLYLSLFLSLVLLPGKSQVYEHPNFAFSSHPTLDVVSVERWADQTVVNLAVKNQRLSGSFCIDPETYLIGSLTEEEFKLERMDGIPACPDVHHFTSIGEVLEFSLVFPVIPEEIMYLNLKENCGEACVSLKYILLDEELNDLINEGFKLYELGKLEAALRIFEDIMQNRYDEKSPAFGTVLIYMISINNEMGRSKEMKALFTRLKNSTIINKEEFIQLAEDEGLVR